jgi:hypothetical protein
MLAGQLVLIAAALFAGAAIYINLAEQPARLDLGDKGLFTEWSTIERGRISHSKKIVRTHVPSSHRGTAASSPYRKSAGCTIATSVSRPDATSYCLGHWLRGGRYQAGCESSH